MDKFLQKSHIQSLVGVISLIAILWSVFIWSLREPPWGVSPSSFAQKDRLVGPWFEIARFDNRVESPYADQITILLKREIEKNLRLVLTGHERKTGQILLTKLAAQWADQNNSATLLVPCLKWLTCGLHVLDVDQVGMSWVIVTGPTRDYLWILARVPGIQPDLLDKLMLRAEAAGYDLSQLKINNHPPAIFKPVPRASELPQSASRPPANNHSTAPTPPPEGPAGFINPMDQAPDTMMDEPPPMPAAPQPMPNAPPAMPAAPPPMPEVILPEPPPLPPLPDEESGESLPEGSERSPE